MRQVPGDGDCAGRHLHDGVIGKRGGRFENEGPQHLAAIGESFAVGKFHITVDQFATFVAETHYETASKCSTYENGRWEEREGRSWRNPGFAQNGLHPAVCLSWIDARAYVDWLATFWRKIDVF